ncbi:uncharacterized protein OCT59_027252 [Rhizophagus irregularis]|uniref:uncharacterized protein n=1 Tax=Rhizophagus irregularis TaxID=588596 RepID=UPI00331AA9A9|nr:hypothetical protein OCT59_027252 [Rhizophagus irregularis]
MIIFKWTKFKLEITDEIENVYKFKLLLRESRDGFTREKFHDIYDNQFRTITIIKLDNSDEILGGYNPIKWESNDAGNYGTTEDNFIFSFENSDDIENYIFSRVKDEEFAILNYNHACSAFGKFDLCLIGKTVYCENDRYEKQISRKAADKFYVEDYEVFQILN